MSNHESIDRRKFIALTGATGVATLAGCSGNGDGNGGNGGGNGNGNGNGNGDDNTGDDTSGGDGEWVPERNLRVIVPWGAGGGTDTATRGVAQPAEQILQEDRGLDININVENITGANGMNAAREVLNQPADGYTLLANTNVIVPNIVSGRADFSVDDWSGVCRVQHDTSWLVGTGDDGLDTYFESAEALAEFGQDNTVLAGLTGGVASAVFIYQCATAGGFWENTQLVSYDDAGQMWNDTATGEIHFGFGEIHEFVERYDAGELSGLAIGKEGRLDEPYSDIPTTVELGWGDATWGVTRGVNAKGGTPEEALVYWQDLWEEAMQSESYQELAAETMVDLRPGFAPRDEWMEGLQNERSLFVTVRDALQDR